MNGKNNDSKNFPKKKKTSWLGRILKHLPNFLPCKHEWEITEVIRNGHDYSGFKYEVCRCVCTKCGKANIEKFLA